MKLTIINIANKMPAWVISACDEYLRRINQGNYFCNLIEIKADKIAYKKPLDNMLAQAKKIKSQIPPGSFVIALDEQGAKFTSLELANQFKQLSIIHSHLTFIIGGADGIHSQLITKANLVMQLSSLTFPHALVRVILLEQLYRVISILNNHPYHRE